MRFHPVFGPTARLGAAALVAATLLSACTSDGDSFNATLGHVISEDEGVLDTSLVLWMSGDPECLNMNGLVKRQATSDETIYVGSDSLRLWDLTDGTPFSGAAVYMHNSDLRLLEAEGVFETVDAKQVSGRVELLDSFFGNAPTRSKRTFRARVCPDRFIALPDGDEVLDSERPKALWKALRR